MFVVFSNTFAKMNDSGVVDFVELEVVIDEITGEKLFLNVVIVGEMVFVGVELETVADEITIVMLLLYVVVDLVFVVFANVFEKMIESVVVAVVELDDVVKEITIVLLLLDDVGERVVVDSAVLVE